MRRMVHTNLIPGKSALVVDDQKSIRLLLHRMLQQHGMTVVEAPGGMQALVEISNHHFDVIFMDLGMPEFSGEDSIKAIKELQPGACIIVYSAFGDPSARERLKGMGVAAMIEKPATSIEIMEAVKQVLGGGTAL